jgi:oligosaccharide repeat unit polymerase
MMDNTFSSKRVLLLSLLYSAGFLIFFVSVWSVESKLRVSYLLLLILLLVLLSYFVLQERLNLFEPMTLFTAYYFTTIPACYYVAAGNFETGEYVTNFSHNVHWLFNRAILYLIIGYLSALFGYYVVKKKGKITIKYESVSQISDKILLVFIFVNFFAGVFNFFYNVLIISGGDLAAYMSTMSIRHALDIEVPHTTLFYINTYLSIYLLIYYLKRNGKSGSILFWPLAVAVFMLASTGRVYSTISYILSIVAVYYYINYNQFGKRYNRKYILWLVIITSSSLMLYIYRLATSVMLNVKSFFSVFEFLVDQKSLESLNIIFFAKGNIPNIPVLMKIIDSWGTDIGFLYGQSLVSWVVNILPTFIRPEGYQPSVMIMMAGWFPNALGAHPPTGIGEMYANFGVLGPFLGMFLFGSFCGFLYNLLLRFNNFWMLVAYSQILTGFVFLYAKGEFDNLSLWQVVPIVVSYLFLHFSTLLLRSQNGVPEKGFG